MDSAFNKIVVGLALENEIYNNRVNQTLITLFSQPDPDSIRRVHDQFLASTNYLDWEVAFWLELAFESTPLQMDLPDLLEEMKEIEVLLSNLLWQVNIDSQYDFNGWLNYIINVGQSVQDGFGMDAKILMSLALQCSRRETIEKAKTDLNLKYKIEILQTETFRLFQEIKTIPLKLVLSKERQVLLVEVQTILIDLLLKYYLGDFKSYPHEFMRYMIEKLESSQRYLMRSDLEINQAKQEIILIHNQLEQVLKDITLNETRKWIIKKYSKIQILLNTFSISNKLESSLTSNKSND